MKPPIFTYERPESLEDTLALLGAEADRAKVLAGGQSLVPLMNLRLASPELLVDIGRLDELRGLGSDDGALRIGALTTHATVEHDSAVAERCPLLAEAIRFVGHGAIRNRGTVGGSIAHADPAAELPLVLLALGGEVTVRSSSGSRQVAAGDFFHGFLMTAIEPSELLTEVAFPPAARDQGFAFEQFARRPGDFGLVSVACVASLEGDRVASARIVLGGIGPAPVLLEGLDDLGASVDEAAAAAGEAAHAAAADVAPDIHASPEYRRHLARELTKRALARAAAGRG
jgi:CO/xanthine dehydrogenase FAD-binding subunit